MKIKEAIEELELGVFTAENRGAQKLADALKLGIEALKRVQEVRQEVYSTAHSLLLGETILVGKTK